MEHYKYGLFSKILYRYANIIATPILLIHLLSSIMIMLETWYFIFFALINSLIIIVLNKYYYKTYQNFPFEIFADNEKIICRNFFLSKKSYEIKHVDISKISGGFFSGWPTRPVYIHDKKNNVTIGFYSHVGNFQKLVTKILQNVPQHLYNEIVDNLKKNRSEVKK
ncbi:MAG: hypothetical protein FJ214_07540 [Ignavibacteria bacterium]|nr:hypothetical protein [Ignavibacteria bacterium]